MRILTLATFIGLLLSGCGGREHTLGKSFVGTPVSIAAAKETSDKPSVIVAGTMTEKCPVAGCWFTLRDDSGVIKVDTKSAGFVVLDVPLRSQLVVSGQIVTNGSERSINASGVRY